MKAVLISIQPKWCELIANGKKTIEVRKTRPKLDTPFKCYIYCTNKYEGGYFSRHNEKIGFYSAGYNGELLQGKVIGEFVCDWIGKCKIDNIEPNTDRDRLYIEHPDKTCLTLDELVQYVGIGKSFYDWHISDLKIYDEPKDVWEFKKKCKKDDNVCGNCYHHGLVRDGYIVHGKCFTDGYKFLTSAPKSWCYVEENNHD